MVWEERYSHFNALLTSQKLSGWMVGKLGYCLYLCHIFVDKCFPSVLWCECGHIRERARLSACQSRELLAHNHASEMTCHHLNQAAWLGEMFKDCSLKIMKLGGRMRCFLGNGDCYKFSSTPQYVMESHSFALVPTFHSTGCQLCLPQVDREERWRWGVFHKSFPCAYCI